MTDKIDNKALIEVLRRSIWREQERISNAEKEIFKLKLELLEAGGELPLGE